MGVAASLFFTTDSSKETLHSRIVPTDSQIDFLRANWNALADEIVVRLKDRSGFSIKTWLQGSYKFGTVIRPISLFETYDVDLGVYFLWGEGSDSTPSPQQLRSWVQDELIRYAGENSDVENVEQPPKERCCRVHYKQQFHVDVPVYHLDESKDLRRLATETHGWESSDPKAIYLWFKDQSDIPGRTQVRRIVRYLKAWAALRFSADSEARPTSILLTVLATDACSEVAIDGQADDDVLAAVVDHICTRLDSSPTVVNPIDADENLSRLSDAGFGEFSAALSKLLEICTRGCAATDEGAAALTC